MKQALSLKTVRAIKPLIVRVCTVSLGLVFLFAGTGKVLGKADFVLALNSLFLTREMVNAIATYLPWLEIGLGLLLVLGVLPVISSVLSVALVSGFIASNSWALASDAGTSIRCGDCFGVWERFLGSPSASEALAIDIVMLSFALAMLALHIYDSRERLHAIMKIRKP